MEVSSAEQFIELTTGQKSDTKSLDQVSKEALQKLEEDLERKQSPASE